MSRSYWDTSIKCGVGRWWVYMWVGGSVHPHTSTVSILDSFLDYVFFCTAKYSAYFLPYGKLDINQFNTLLHKYTQHLTYFYLYWFNSIWFDGSNQAIWGTSTNIYISIREVLLSVLGLILGGILLTMVWYDITCMDIQYMVLVVTHSNHLEWCLLVGISTYIKLVS